MLSNGELQRSVADAIAGAFGSTVSDIAVAVDGGLVTLRGEVLTFSEREAVERRVWAVDGVTAVINEIVATQDPVGVRVDCDLAQNARAALVALGSGFEAVAVSVVDRAATLSGEIEDEVRRQLARGAVATVPGLRSITALVRVIGALVPGEPERRIAEAFTAEGMTGPERVVVATHDHLAQLTGALDSVAERDVAVAAVETTPGITGIDNELTIP